LVPPAKAGILWDFPVRLHPVTETPALRPTANRPRDVARIDPAGSSSTNPSPALQRTGREPRSGTSNEKDAAANDPLRQPNRLQTFVTSNRVRHLVAKQARSSFPFGKIRPVRRRVLTLATVMTLTLSAAMLALWLISHFWTLGFAYQGSRAAWAWK
jgi:hypothetical protein